MTVCLFSVRPPPQDASPLAAAAPHKIRGKPPPRLATCTWAPSRWPFRPAASSLGVPQPLHTPTPESSRLPMLSWCSTRCGTRTSSLQRHCRLLRRPRVLTPRVVSHRLYAQEQLQPRQGRVHLQLPAAASTQAWWRTRCSLVRLAVLTHRNVLTAQVGSPLGCGVLFPYDVQHVRRFRISEWILQMSEGCLVVAG
jgi:hypothetical protein